MATHDAAGEGMTSPAATDGRGRGRRAALSFVFSIALIVLDQVTKQLALHHLSMSEDVPVLGRFLSLRLFFNSGATLGLGAAHTWVISLFACAACVLLGWCVLRTDSTAWSLTAALALAGAAGNLLDRIVYSTGFLNGRVVDFLNYGWSIGNVADVYLTLAAIIAIILLLCSVPFNGQKDAAQDDDAHDGTAGDDHARQGGAR